MFKVVGCGHLFCKPVAKLPSDRTALQEVVRSGNPKFFLGSDSAPHARHKKEAFSAAAGVYTSSHLCVYLADTFDRLGMMDRLENFACRFGAEYFGIPVRVDEKPVKLIKRQQIMPEFVGGVDDIKQMLSPFRFLAPVNFVVELPPTE